MKPKEKQRKVRVCKFDPERTPFEILEVLAKGGTMKEALKVVDLTNSTLEHHRKRWPVLDKSIRLGAELGRWVKQRLSEAAEQWEKNSKTQAKEGETFKDYALGCLPPDLRRVWDEWIAVEELDDAADVFTELTQGMGKASRQHLFIKCFLYGSFSIQDACRRTGISRTRVDFWINQDPVFAAMFREVRTAQKDFVESALMDLVALRNPQAVIFASKTLNRDRGYGETLEVNINNNDPQFDLDALDLSLECRKEILAAIQKQKALVAGTIEATVVRRIENKKDEDDDYEFEE